MNSQSQIDIVDLVTLFRVFSSPVVVDRKTTCSFMMRGHVDSSFAYSQCGVETHLASGSCSVQVFGGNVRWEKQLDFSSTAVGGIDYPCLGVVITARQMVRKTVVFARYSHHR